MKRKLIKYEDFQRRTEGVLSKAVTELIEAEEYLAKVVGADATTLVSYDTEECLFEVNDGTFLSAAYSIEQDKIVLEGVEHLVLDEGSEKEQATSILSELLEAVLDDKTVEAETLMDKYVRLDSLRRKRSALTEATINEADRVRLYGTRGKGGKPKLFARKGSKNQDKSRAAKLGWALHRGKYKSGMAKRTSKIAQERSRRKKYKLYHSTLRAKSGGQQYTGKRHRKSVNEWLNLAKNVFGYLEIAHAGHVLAEATITPNEDGTSTITLPTSQRRNEGKVLMMQFDVLKTDVKILRESARKLTNDGRFCQLVADCRRFNALSDDKRFEETLHKLVSGYPSVLYLTQGELATAIAEALQSSGVQSFDDDQCKFISEGILRTAHGAYSDRVTRIMRLARQDGSEYEKFQSAVAEFYPQLDESVRLEFKMFEDLYNAVADVRKSALEYSNDLIRTEATSYLNELEEILSGRQPVNLDLAADVADWIETIAESNLEGAGEWHVDKTPHRTVSGDHPQMAKNARVPGHPYAAAADWPDPAPVSDGKSYRGSGAAEMRGKAWGNIANKDTYPDLRNPVQPTPGEFTLHGEKGVDKENNGFATWQDSSDTWPNLKNPYAPASMMPKQRVDPSNSVE